MSPVRLLPALPVLLAPLALAMLPVPALAARRPALLPPLVVPASAPVITATLAGQPVRLRIDPGTDPASIVLTAAAASRLRLDAPVRADGREARRGTLAVAVGQTRIKVPWSMEQVEYAGISRSVRVLTPPDASDDGADGAVSPAMLPHAEVRLVRRAATPADATTVMKAKTGGLLWADTIQADWQLPSGKLEVEFHPWRPVSVVSVAAAARLLAAFGGRLDGPVHRVEIAYGVRRPVRLLRLERAAPLAGTRLAAMDVRLFDWQGGADLPLDASDAQTMTVVASRGRQRGWPIVKLGRDALDRCAEIAWRQAAREMVLVCPLPAEPAG